MGNILRHIARNANSPELQRQAYAGLCIGMTTHTMVPWATVSTHEPILMAIPQGWQPSQVRRSYRELCDYVDLFDQSAVSSFVEL